MEKKLKKSIFIHFIFESVKVEESYYETFGGDSDKKWQR